MAQLPRHKIDHSRGERVASSIPMTVEWVHDIVRAACPRAIAFYLAHSSPGTVEVIVELDDQARSALIESAVESVQKALNQEAPAGCSIIVHAFRSAGPCSRCGTAIGEPHRPGCYVISAWFPAKPPAAAELNKMQDDAVRAIQQRDAEIARLRADVKAHNDALQQAVELADAYRSDKDRAHRALDEMARFLAGLDDLKWSSKDRIEKRAHVNRAAEILKPSGSRVDNKAMEAKVFEERFGKPTVKAAPLPGSPHRIEFSIPAPDYEATVELAKLFVWAAVLGIKRRRDEPVHQLEARVMAKMNEPTRSPWSNVGSRKDES